MRRRQWEQHEQGAAAGALGAALFKYKCLGPSDPQCDFDEQLGTGMGGAQSTLPPIALGAKFGLNFTLNSDVPKGDTPIVTAFHPTFATSDAAAITTVKVGTTTVGIARGPQIIDMADVKIVDAKDLKIFSADPTSEFTDVSVSGGSVKFKGTTTFRFRVAPIDEGGTILAGALTCKWTSSDDNIAKITTAPDDNIVTVVTGSGSGTATIHVDFGPNLKKDIPITVGS